VSDTSQLHNPRKEARRFTRNLFNAAAVVGTIMGSPDSKYHEENPGFHVNVREEIASQWINLT